MRADRGTTMALMFVRAPRGHRENGPWLSSGIVTFPRKKDLDAEVIALLVERDGMPTVVRLVDGRTVTVWNIAWGL